MRRVRLRLIVEVVGFAVGLTLAPGAARAACTVSATGVAFGNYNTLSASPDDSTGTISATCLIFDAAPDVDIGTGNSGTYNPRRMSNGSSNLNYNLYTNAARTIIWGNGTGGTSGAVLTTQSTFLIWRTYARTVYGRIPASQNVSAGTYGDTLIITVTF